MTVGELISLLGAHDPARLVILSGDAEGNRYSPLRGACTAAYRAVTPSRGDVGMEKLTDADRKAGYTEEDLLEGVPALILTPRC